MVDATTSAGPPARRTRGGAALAWTALGAALCVGLWVVRFCDAGGTWHAGPSVADLLAHGAALSDLGDDFAAVSLHVTPVHIATNAVLLVAFLAAWTRLGGRPGLRVSVGLGLAYVAGGAAFGSAHALHDLPSCGASGMVYALLAMVLAALWARRAQLPAALRTRGPLAVTAVALLALGVSFTQAGTDALAHGVGFGFGGILGAAYEAGARLFGRGLSGGRSRGSGTRAR